MAHNQYQVFFVLHLLLLLYLHVIFVFTLFYIFFGILIFFSFPVFNDFCTMSVLRICVQIVHMLFLCLDIEGHIKAVRRRFITGNNKIACKHFKGFFVDIKNKTQTVRSSVYVKGSYLMKSENCRERGIQVSSRLAKVNLSYGANPPNE